MTKEPLVNRAKEYMDFLCNRIPNRRTGGIGNRLAVEYVAGKFASFGTQTELQTFECLDWEHGAVRLKVNDRSFEAYPSSYSLGYHGHARLETASTLAELDTIEAAGGILLLRGELTREQLMPKNFPFYNPEHHQHLIQLLEKLAPEAIITATGRDLSMVGNLYPFNIFEDGDFNIPSVYMKDVDGERLAGYAGQVVTLEFDARRIPTTGANVIARKGYNPRHKFVICAHIDAKEGTPGALDNAAGVTTLLILAELLQEVAPPHSIELVALNGEDHYSAAGQIKYLSEASTELGNIQLAINIDDVGYIKGRNAYSFYECPPEIKNTVREIFSGYDTLVEGEQWYQSDHMIFVQNQVPAMAITEELLEEVMTKITHTEKDVPELIEADKLVELSYALCDLVLDFTR